MESWAGRGYSVAEACLPWLSTDTQAQPQLRALQPPRPQAHLHHSETPVLRTASLGNSLPHPLIRTLANIRRKPLRSPSCPGRLPLLTATGRPFQSFTQPAPLTYPPTLPPQPQSGCFHSAACVGLPSKRRMQDAGEGTLRALERPTVEQKILA